MVLDEARGNIKGCGNCMALENRCCDFSEVGGSIVKSNGDSVRLVVARFNCIDGFVERKHAESVRESSHLLFEEPRRQIHSG